MGLAVSSAVLANVLKTSLPQRLLSVASNVFAAPDPSMDSESDRDTIAKAYANASRSVFIWCLPVAGIVFLLSAFIKDKGLERKGEQVATAETEKTFGVKEPKTEPEPIASGDKDEDLVVRYQKSDAESGSNRGSMSPTRSLQSEMRLTAES